MLFPYFKEGGSTAAEVINKLIPKGKLLLLGKYIEDIPYDFPAVFENYENDIYGALKEALPALRKYEMLKLIFPDNSGYPKDIIKGFYKFCQQNDFSHLLVSNVKKEKIEAGTCYINLAEDDLVELLNKITVKNLMIGKEVGVISYNETPLKKFIWGGITTVSTDFEYMGKAAAQLIQQQSKAHVEVPFYLTLRHSI